MKTRGFTLLELLLVILITGILAAVVAPIVREPVRSYFDQANRAALVDAAEAALRRIARDARRALPYSIRINAGEDAVEFIEVQDAARYRATGGPPNQRLQFNIADTAFNVMGRFGMVGTGALSGDQRLAIFNLGTAGFDAYQGDAVITPPGTAIAITDDGSEHRVTMTPGFQFAAPSPSRRVYIVNGSTSYACNGGGLYRLDGYGYQAAQPSTGDVAAGNVLITDHVSACRFEHDPGSASRPELLNMSITLTRGGESVTLLHQIHVHNAT